MKKVIIIILTILTIIGLHLSIRYTLNEIYISKYNDGDYDSNLSTVLKIINYPESYIVYYNEGNNFYQKSEYEKAVIRYQKALKTVSKKRECPVRTNLALAKLELVNYEKQDILKEELIEIEEILLENDCANKKNSGKDKSSQKLYNQIEELLKSNGQGSGDEPEEPEDPNSGKEENDPNQQPKDIEEKIRKQQEESAKDRENIRDGYDFEIYDGKVW